MRHHLLGVPPILVAIVLSNASVAAGQSPSGPVWHDADIGDVGQPGGSTGSDGTIIVSGSGADIWGTADSFHYIYTSVPGDADLYVFVRRQSAAHPFAKAGLMIRESVSPASPNVLLDIKPDGGLEFMTRPITGPNTIFLDGAQPSYPLWMRLVRRGSYVGAFFATPAMCPSTAACYQWTQLGNWIPWNVGGTVLFGLAVTSHDTTSLNEAVVDVPRLFSLVPPWEQTDSYPDASPDSAWSTADGIFYVPAAGTDIWGVQDSFKYVNQPAFGADAAIIARVDREDFTHAFAKAGVMMRESLNPSAANVLLDVKPDSGIEFLARPAYGAQTQFLAGGYMPFPAWLKLVKSGDDISAYASNDGNSWILVGTTAVSLSPNGAAYTLGLAATAHDAEAPPWLLATFSHVSVSAATPSNLLLEPGFEGYGPPALGAPGWTSDRAIRVVSETAEPHSGRKNGACRQTAYADCGVYQDVVVSTGGRFSVSLFANSDRSGGLAGVDVNGANVASANVEPRGAGNYGSAYTFDFRANLGDTVHVWMYSPAIPGWMTLDDATLAFAGP
jgi:hypothetical protein